MSTQDKVKIQPDLNGEVLDNKDKYVIRGGHVYVKTEQLLQSSKFKQQIEGLHENFSRLSQVLSKVSMIPRYRTDKAIQIATLLLQKEGGTINYTKLIKLMYVIERESILRWGSPTIGDDCYSLPNGPILSHTLDCINGTTYLSHVDKVWDQYIVKVGKYDVTLQKRPELNCLSRAELRLVDEIYEKLGNKSYQELIDWSHDPKNVPEWEDPEGSRLPISIKTILEKGGYSPEEVEQTLAEFDSMEAAKNYFAA